MRAARGAVQRNTAFSPFGPGRQEDLEPGNVVGENVVRFDGDDLADAADFVGDLVVAVGFAQTVERDRRVIPDQRPAEGHLVAVGPCAVRIVRDRKLPRRVPRFGKRRRGPATATATATSTAMANALSTRECPLYCPRLWIRDHTSSCTISQRAAIVNSLWARAYAAKQSAVLLASVCFASSSGRPRGRGPKRDSQHRHVQPCSSCPPSEPQQSPQRCLGRI